MQPPSGIHALVSHTHLFYLFEIEQPLAIRERVQRHDAQWLSHFLRKKVA
jgi:hypothetical protein